MALDFWQQRFECQAVRASKLSSALLLILRYSSGVVEISGEGLRVKRLAILDEFRNWLVSAA